MTENPYKLKITGSQYTIEYVEKKDKDFFSKFFYEALKRLKINPDRYSGDLVDDLTENWVSYNNPEILKSFDDFAKDRATAIFKVESIKAKRSFKAVNATVAIASVKKEGDKMLVKYFINGIVSVS